MPTSDSFVTWSLFFCSVFRILIICFVKYEQSCLSSSRSCEEILIYNKKKVATAIKSVILCRSWQHNFQIKKIYPLLM